MSTSKLIAPKLTEAQREALELLGRGFDLRPYYVRKLVALGLMFAHGKRQGLTDAGRAALKEGGQMSAPRYCCAVCGGTSVQHAMWVNLNAPHDVQDEYGSWCNGDNSWCSDCGEHVQINLIEKKAGS